MMYSLNILIFDEVYDCYFKFPVMMFMFIILTDTNEHSRLNGKKKHKASTLDQEL